MRRPVFAFFVAVLAFGCASAGLQVTRELAPGADVSGWRSYAWSGPVPTASDELVREAHQRIRAAVDTELQNKGYRRVAPERADFLVSHSIYADLDIPELSKREKRAMREQDIATGHLDRELPPGVGYGGHASGEGALYLFFTRPDGRNAWTGAVETVLNYRGAGLTRVPVAIRQLLKDFPNGPGVE